MKKQIYLEIYKHNFHLVARPNSYIKKPRYLPALVSYLCKAGNVFRLNLKSYCFYSINLIGTLFLDLITPL